MEKNRGNQLVVASLTQQGVVQPSLLENLPLVVEDSEEGLRIRTGGHPHSGRFIEMEGGK
jgi:hypothetical protein